MARVSNPLSVSNSHSRKRKSTKRSEDGDHPRKRRGPAPRACHHCKLNKKRCSQHQPCTECFQGNIQCVYPAGQPARPPACHHCHHRQVGDNVDAEYATAYGGRPTVGQPADPPHILDLAAENEVNQGNPRSETEVPVALAPDTERMLWLYTNPGEMRTDGSTASITYSDRKWPPSAPFVGVNAIFDGVPATTTNPVEIPVDARGLLHLFRQPLQQQGLFAQLELLSEINNWRIAPLMPTAVVRFWIFQALPWTRPDGSTASITVRMGSLASRPMVGTTAMFELVPATRSPAEPAPVDAVGVLQLIDSAPPIESDLLLNLDWLPHDGGPAVREIFPHFEAKDTSREEGASQVLHEASV